MGNACHGHGCLLVSRDLAALSLALISEDRLLFLKAPSLSLVFNRDTLHLVCVRLFRVFFVHAYVGLSLHTCTQASESSRN